MGERVQFQSEPDRGYGVADHGNGDCGHSADVFGYGDRVDDYDFNIYVHLCVHAGTHDPDSKPVTNQCADLHERPNREWRQHRDLDVHADGRD